MTAPQTAATTDPQRIIAALRQQLEEQRAERDTALAENAALAEELAARTAELGQRNTEYSERIEYQAATIEVLKAMSASPGDTQPVFDLIARQAVRLCNVQQAAVGILDGTMLHLAASSGFDPAVAERIATTLFPRPLGPDLTLGRAIINRRAEHVEDITADKGHVFGREFGPFSNVAVPMLRDGKALGAVTMGRWGAGRFSDSQVELLTTFAEQAVIAITSAETYRALQTRTSDLQETLEYQTATSEVLNVISRSTFDLEPVFQTVASTAVRLCNADQAGIYLHQNGEYRWAGGYSQLPEYERIEREVKILPGAGTLVGRVALEGRPVQVLDAWNDTLYEAKEDARVGGIHTLLGVPLLRDGSPIGVIGLGRQKIEPFTERQIELVSTFAAQAVIAMENARLLTEQQEALEQQTATAEVLQVINASPGDLAPVFEAMVERAATLCEADEAAVRTVDGSVLNLVATHGPADIFEELKRLGPSHPDGLYEAIAQGASVTHFVDVRETEAFQTNARARERLELRGIRSWLAVALRKEGALLGVINVHRREVRPFTDKQIALLENFAAQAVIAMENARLLTETREALEQQTATAEVLQVINSSPGKLAPVFDTILDKAMRLCEAAFGGLFTYDGERFHTVATLGTPTALTEFRTRNPPSPLPGSTSARLLETRRTHHILDRAQEPDYLAGEPGARAMVELGGARSMLNVPLIKDDNLLAYISIYRQEVRPFSDKQIALLENFAAQAVIAMENARLLEEVRQRQEELRVTFENMGDGVAMFDETQHLVAWNGKFQDILDVPDDIIARRQTFSEYVRYLAERGEYGREANPEEHVRRLIEQAGQSRTYERTRPDGRVIEVRNNPVAGGGFVLIFSDITERKRSEAEIRAARDAAEEASRTIEAAYRELKTAQANLIQTEKMASLGQLTAGIAHEIKNPLNFVNNFSALSIELIDELRDVLAPEPLGETVRTEVDDVTALLKGNLEKVVQHGQRADGIVRSMLDHSRGSSVERRMVDLNALIDEALNLAYHGARAQDQSFNITLERDFGAGIAPIEVNPQDITRVFLNLFANGFYAATRPARDGRDAGFMPTLKVTTIDAGEAVEIRVRDNGAGIPADIRDKLFQPFFTTKPTGEGTGLGLSITYDIVTQQHGGSIAVDSEVGEYSEFAIRLPRKP
jgi:GAF domain-containing protein/nitrogen-specific signal transduction histidine kinase